MSFFDDLPEQPARPREPQPAQPGWLGPPSDELPGIARVGGFVHKDSRTVVVLKLVEVYSTGCLFDLVWSVRRGTESDQEWREMVEESYNRPRSSLDTRDGTGTGCSCCGRTQGCFGHPRTGGLRRRSRHWPCADNLGRRRWKQQLRVRSIHRQVLVMAVANGRHHARTAMGSAGDTGKLTCPVR